MKLIHKIEQFHNHRKTFFDLSEKYIGNRYKYWNHDLDKLIYTNKHHKYISHHHPKDYTYWQFTWVFNNWEEICLDLEAKGGAQQIIEKDYPWASMYAEVILKRWNIWKDNKTQNNTKEYIEFNKYIKCHKNNPMTWKL